MHPAAEPSTFIVAMPETIPSVVLLAHTPNPLALIYAACRQCYFEGDVADIWPDLTNPNFPVEKQADLVGRIIASGHASTIEHVTFTFAISGVSRALTHQLVRHRIASYSQQSQRYVDACHFDYVEPPRIKANPHAHARFIECMEQIAATYSELQTILKAAGGKSNEDARFVLPQAAASRIVVTMNCRSLLNFFEHRCCMRAQWEIRHVANAMLKQCHQILPEVFAKAGPRCERLGFCPEGKLSCGRYPAHS